MVVKTHPELFTSIKPILIEFEDAGTRSIEFSDVGKYDFWHLINDKNLLWIYEEMLKRMERLNSTAIA